MEETTLDIRVVDGMIILKWNKDMRFENFSGFAGLNIWFGGTPCEIGTEPSGRIRRFPTITYNTQNH
jgi:hypothetical protein